MKVTVTRLPNKSACHSSWIQNWFRLVNLTRRRTRKSTFPCNGRWLDLPRPHSSRLRFCCAMILFKDLKFFISIFQSGKYSLISYWSGASYKVNFWNTFCSLHDLRSYRKQRITQKWGLHEAPPKRQFTKYYGIFRFGESSVVGVMILLVLTTTLGLTEN